jgi:hypothetical protein
MSRIAAIVALTGSLFFMADVQDAQAQYVTTWYTPAPTVGVVPVRRGLFGLRTDYVPVVTGSVPVPVTSVVTPAPGTVTTMYAPATVYSPPVTNYYMPMVPVTPVTTYYAPPPVPVTTYYTPPILIGR